MIEYAPQMPRDEWCAVGFVLHGYVANVVTRFDPDWAKQTGIGQGSRYVEYAQLVSPGVALT